MRDQDADKPHNPSDLKRTDAGRPVYSGGGIEPDKRVAGPARRASTRRRSAACSTRAGEFENYAQKFTRRRRHAVAQQPTGRVTVKPNFVVDDAMMADFREQLKADTRQDRRSGVHRRTSSSSGR